MDIAPIVFLQVLTGLGLLTHGIPKLLDLKRTLKWFAKQGYGVIVGFFTTVIETAGAFLMIVGIFPRFMAGLIALTMLGAMFHHWKDREAFKDGWETAYLYFVTSVVIVLGGIGWI